MSKIKQLISRNSLHSEYQPLLSVNNDSIFAYEALMRSEPHINPLTLIEAARECDNLYELDTACITNAIEGFPIAYLENHYLFINILPSTIIHKDFENYISRLLLLYPKIKSSVVFEISEDVSEEHIWNQRLFMHRLSFLKSLEFYIAFDDLSVSKTSFEKMELLTPDYVKLDHTKSRNLSSSLAQQQLISLFLEYTHENMKLVLEGIEAEEDFITAKKLGVPLLQGYFISKPSRLA
ncbi:EAL domain-containing protein [Ureibacillus sinduriensis]|uniref:EAL domain-containing protein n=1 Tax=Ureibacillus sinduriensis TaxID=561440 RepID=UPI001594FA14|nr:EAL domain-containing protein [Ureibacillus sinduriensis]